MTTHIWSILDHKESLWVKWIHSYRLSNRSFWDVPIPSNCSWGWHKYYSFEIRNAGFSLHIKVSDLVMDGNWKWPDEWLDLYPALNGLPSIIIRPHIPDSLYWKDKDGNEVEFSSYAIWNTLRQHHQQVPWGNGVWHTVRHLAYMQNVQEKWDDVAEWMIQKRKSNLARTVIGKLLVAATTYFIWQERNMRLQSNKSRPVEKILDIISTRVRLKLVTLRFKNTKLANHMVEDWNLPRHLVIYDQGRID
uniref:uncharacterized protein LOC122604342 n=1 Tax=Erigeron canadensis TaxID=72917 RepID=UPI001CB9539D|nr:uncharacterized protein LOC122604342 [Erigeron canadensis]